MFSDVLLTVDFDRTLTAPDSTIPERNLRAVEFFMENGGVFTVNTGRSVPSSMKHLIPSVPVNAPLLLYNGSAEYDKETGTFVRAEIIDLDPEQVLPELQARFPEIRIELQGVDAHYLLVKDTGFERYCTHNGMPWDYMTPGSIPGPFIKFALYGRYRDETVASMYDATQEELDRLQAGIDYVRQTYGDKVDIFRACPQIVDVHAKGCSKLRSARMLQQRLGRKILVCVGDAENDLTMLRGADYADRPSDGIIADQFENVCPCAEGAVADVIYRKIPKILGLPPIQENG